MEKAVSVIAREALGIKALEIKKRTKVKGESILAFADVFRKRNSCEEY